MKPKISTLIIIYLLFVFNAALPYQLSLKFVKDAGFSLTANFLKELATIFNAKIFIETGTLAGGTTNNAAPFFEEIHTIELSKDFYEKAAERFKNTKNVFVYEGDSSKILFNILPKIESKILFWLDGHYSGGPTAKGETNTPVLQELRAIKECGINNAVILIDDIRCFQLVPNIPENKAATGYPTIDQIREALLEINKDYNMMIYGDIAIAFLNNEVITFSPVIQACTVSRMLEPTTENLEKIFEAENIIAQAQGEEKQVIQRLHSIFQGTENAHNVGKHYRLWYALTLYQDKLYAQAQKQFYKAISLGCSKDYLKKYKL